MSPIDPKLELQKLIDETTSVLGSTDQTYIQFLQLMNKTGRLMMPHRLMPGLLIIFKYEPISESFISRNTYYDKFPLVLVTNSYKGGFEGVNIHFLDLEYRKFLFDALMRDLPKIRGSEDWKTRLLVDYDRLDARRKFRFFKPCYRKYLWKGVERRPVVVPFDLWEDMMESHSMKFQNAKPVTVFRKSRQAITRNSIRGK